MSFGDLEKIPNIPPHGWFLHEMPGDVCLGLPCGSFDFRSTSICLCRAAEIRDFYQKQSGLRTLQIQHSQDELFFNVIGIVW